MSDGALVVSGGCFLFLIFQPLSRLALSGTFFELWRPLHNEAPQSESSSPRSRAHPSIPSPPGERVSLRKGRSDKRVPPSPGTYEKECRRRRVSESAPKRSSLRARAQARCSCAEPVLWHFSVVRRHCVDLSAMPEPPQIPLPRLQKHHCSAPLHEISPRICQASGGVFFSRERARRKENSPNEARRTPA